jgi:AcrR family transcriptional regulator
MPRNLSPSDVGKFRDRLCDVATQLLAEVGSEGFNMRELAARMGVSAMTTYRYFKDKHEILLVVREKAFGRFADRLEAAISGYGSREEKLAALGLAYVRFASDERVHYALMFDLSAPQPASGTHPEEIRARAAMAASLRRDDARFEGDTTATILWAALHGVVALHLGGKLNDAEFGRALSQAMSTVADAPVPHFIVPLAALDSISELPARTQPEPAHNHVCTVALTPAE